MEYEKGNKKMKGLVLKDLYYLRGFARQYLLVFAFMALWSVLIKNASFAVTYLLVMGNSLVLSTLSMDDAVSFNRFALTMPVNMKMLVKAKYVVMVLLEGGMLLTGLLTGFLVEVMPRRINGGSRWIYTSFEWEGTVVLFMLFMTVGSVSLPMVYKQGVEKARNICMMILLGLAVLVFGGLKLAQMAGLSMENLNEILEAIPEGMWAAIPVGVCMAALMISYGASLRIVRNKEW